jgi:hypothetical protein
VVEILFLVTFPAIAKSQPDAHRHDCKRRRHQDFDGPAKSLLPVFRSGRSCAVAHRAALRERGGRPQAQKPNQHGSATPCPTRLWRLHRRSHLTPNEMMRNASGKKTIIMHRQNTSEHMVSHFMRDTSYFMCMK